MDLTHFRTLGRSGLVVSPFALGTMTFDAKRWGSGEAASRAVFNAYVDAGGNFLDTADVYSGGESEAMLGRFVAERGMRDRLVIATKAGFSRETGHPHAGGNGAKNIHTALEGSLRRLGTDYVDLFWIHVWDQVTPAEEVLQTLTSLVRAGKTRYFGLSNVPAWYVAKMCTLAAAHGAPGPVALQMAYSLVERGIEFEHVPAAREFGLAIQPWAPLAAGLLTGKYTREGVAGRAALSRGLPTAGGADEAGSDGRLNGANPFGDTLFTDRNWAALDVLRAVAAELDRTPAQVALAWVLARPLVTGLLMGASRVEQVAANIAALEVQFTADQHTRLDAAATPDTALLYQVLSPGIRRMVFGGMEVAAYQP